MIVLALETSSQVCSVALLRDGQIVAEAALNRPRAHAEQLVPMIADILREGAVERTQVSAIAVSSGPGSYTGLRIGVSTAKGFAAATGCSLVAVPSLQALAERVRARADRNDLIGAAFDARRDEAYAALYRVHENGSLEQVRETAAIRDEEAVSWLDSDGNGALFLVGDGWIKMRELLGALPHNMLEGEDALPSAVPVAHLGAGKLERGDVEDVVTFEPYYLKEFVATKPRATAFEKLSF